MRGSELAIFGAEGEAAREGLWRTALKSVDLDRLDLLAASPDDLPPELAIAGIKPERLPAALLCEARVCRAPVFSAEGLSGLLNVKG